MSTEHTPESPDSWQLEMEETAGALLRQGVGRHRPPQHGAGVDAAAEQERDVGATGSTGVVGESPPDRVILELIPLDLVLPQLVLLRVHDLSNAHSILMILGMNEYLLVRTRRTLRLHPS